MPDIIINDKPSIVYFWNNIIQKDEQKLTQALQEMPTPKFVKIGKLLNIKAASSKEETIPLLVAEIKQLEVGMNAVPEKSIKKDAKKEKKMEEVVQTETKKDYPVMQIKIKEEYLALVPRPSEDQMNTLMESIKKDGLKEEIETLDDGTIIDGHSRFEALRRLDMLPVPPDKIKIMHFDSEVNIKEYIFTKNVPRRHLSDIDRIILTKQFLPTIEAELKEAAQKKKSEKIAAVKRGEAAPQEKKERTTDKIAQMAGVSGAQQTRYNYVEKWCPEKLAEAQGDKGKKLGNIYLEVKAMKDQVESKMPELIQQIQDKQITLTQAYDTVMEMHPIQPDEKEPGPLAKNTQDVISMIKKVWRSKYNTDDPTLDEWDSKIMERLNARYDQFMDKGK